jgi:hypothetical protein
MNSIEAQEIIGKIRKVDWYYNYSDDYSVWKRGEASMSEVKHFANSREWSADDIATLKLEVNNLANLQMFKTEERKQEFVAAWIEKIDYLFKVKES